MSEESPPIKHLYRTDRKIGRKPTECHPERSCAFRRHCTGHESGYVAPKKGIHGLATLWLTGCQQQIKMKFDQGSLKLKLKNVSGIPNRRKQLCCQLGKT